MDLNMLKSFFNAADYAAVEFEVSQVDRYRESPEWCLRPPESYHTCEECLLDFFSRSRSRNRGAAWTDIQKALCTRAFNEKCIEVFGCSGGLYETPDCSSATAAVEQALLEQSVAQSARASARCRL